MVNLFRKIRKGLTPQNKFGKLLVKAIGEVLLLVTGILIALNVNNWNQARINSNKEKTYISDIQRDLKDQLSSIGQQLEQEKKYVMASAHILNYYAAISKFKANDSLMNDLSLLMGRKTFVRIDPTYTELLSTGNLGLIKKNRFKNELIEYYQELERVEKVIDKNNTLFTDQQFVKEVINFGYFEGPLTLYPEELDTLAKLGIATGVIKEETRLQAITQKQLDKEENELQLINLVKYRGELAALHFLSMRDLSRKTKKLMTLLEQSYP